MGRGDWHTGRARVGLGGDAVDGVRDDRLPYGVDTIVLRMEWPAAAAPRGYNGRMWRMRPLRGWTGGQAASQGMSRPGDETAGSLNLPVSDSDRVEARRDQAPDGGLVQEVHPARGWTEPSPFLPPAIPGTPDNDYFFKSNDEMFKAIRGALGIEPSPNVAMPRSDVAPQAGDPTSRGLGGTFDNPGRPAGRDSAAQALQVAQAMLPGTMTDAGGGVTNVALAFDPKAQGVPVVLPDGSNVPDSHSPTGLLMSPYAGVSNVAESGRRTGATYFSMINSSVEAGDPNTYLVSQLALDLGHGGRFDYQRQGTPIIGYAMGFTQSPQFRDAANFNVGLYMQQAGFTLDETLSIAGRFANIFSINRKPGLPYGLDSQTADFIKVGYNAGVSGVFSPTVTRSN